MIHRVITLARSWHVAVRIGIVTAAVAAATALQFPVESHVPGEPFLPFLVVVVLSLIYHWASFGQTEPVASQVFAACMNLA